MGSRAEAGPLPDPLAQRLLEVLTHPVGQELTEDQPADLLVVFGCDQAELAREAAAIHARGVVRHVVFTGNVGKDSGDLAALGIPEADFLASVALAHGLAATAVTMEREARNGAENALFALRAAAAAGKVSTGASVASLAPAARARRLYEELRFQAASFDETIRVVAGLSVGRDALRSGLPETYSELCRELNALSSMHMARPPRVFRLPEFQDSGEHADLLQCLRR